MKIATENANAFKDDAATSDKIHFSVEVKYSKINLKRLVRTQTHSNHDVKQQSAHIMCHKYYSFAKDGNVYIPV